MKHGWLSVFLALALVAIGFGVLPAPGVLAGAATTTYDYVSAYIPDDSTPIVVRVTFSNLTIGDCYVYKARLYKTSTYYGETWNATTSNWIATGGVYSSQNQFTATATSQSFWVYVRNSTLAASATSGDARLAIVAASGGTTCAAGPSFNNGTPANVTVIQMTAGGTPAQFGGWLEETNSPARADRAIVIKNGSTIIGMYVAENNGVNEGYPAVISAAPAAPVGAGYFKIAVPDCVSCNYTVESWALTTPGSAVGQVNTLGAGGCPNTITAGSTTSLDTCSAPTAITLRTLSATAQSTMAVPVVGLMLLGGLATLVRRRKA
jgi:hypothetical protein